VKIFHPAAKVSFNKQGMSSTPYPTTAKSAVEGLKQGMPRMMGSVQGFLRMRDENRQYPETATPVKQFG